MKVGGCREPDDGTRTRPDDVTHQLVTLLGLTANRLEQSMAGAAPAPALDKAPNLAIRVAGQPSLANAEDAVRDGTFRIGLEHSPTIADRPATPRRACG